LLLQILLASFIGCYKEKENSILDMDNFTFAEITILESKIIHIDGKIIYFFFAIYLLILHSANRI